MNIKLAWPFDFSAYKSLFPEITLFNWDTDVEENIDLMVFPGGEDVSLEYYCSNETVQQYKDLCCVNRERDTYELKILEACYKKLRVNKILGVCRGLQFINVMFDGKLFPDLNSKQIGHNRIHDLLHVVPSNLNFLKTVNSLHHQGIRTNGGYTRLGNRSYPVVIATDKESGYVPEIMTWEKDRILGVQFHPEYFWENNPDKDAFREFIYSWIAGKTTILK